MIFLEFGKNKIEAIKCFQVKDRNGKYLQGEERTKQVVKELLRLPLNQQPEDFQNLVALLKTQINS